VTLPEREKRRTDQKEEEENSSTRAGQIKNVTKTALCGGGGGKGRTIRKKTGGSFRPRTEHGLCIAEGKGKKARRDTTILTPIEHPHGKNRVISLEAIDFYSLLLVERRLREPRGRGRKEKETGGGDLESNSLTSRKGPFYIFSGNHEGKKIEGERRKGLILYTRPGGK